MKFFVPRILTGLLACLIVAQTIQAQTNPLPDGTFVPDPVASPPIVSDVPGSAVVQNYFGYTEVDRAFEPLLRFDTRAGSLMGQDGFQRVSAFNPFWADPDTMVFVDLGGYATFRPSGGANVGVGWRGYFDDLDRIIGVNAWYDFDAGHQEQYHQFGVGFESLGRYLDYRVNGYIPFTQTSNLLSNGIIGGGNPSFLGNSIYLDRYYRHETAFKGFDAEMGGPVPMLGKYGLSAYAGMYFFSGLNVGNITGATARLTGQINEDLTVGAQFSHDNVFDNNVQIQVSWTIPDGGAGRWFRQQTVRDRMTAPVQRLYRVVAHDEVVVASEQAINPIDNKPYFVAHVDPNRTPGTGNGSIDNPYSLISQFDNLGLGEKSNVDIVYVRPRLDPTNPTAQLDTGVSLLSNQRLLSTSVGHSFDVIAAQADLNGSRTYDLPTIPGFPIGSQLPILSNVNGGDVVTLTAGAQNIEVSGFQIRGNRMQQAQATGTNQATNDGIAGVDNQKININRNVITQAVNGIRLRNLSGTVAAGTASSISQNSMIPVDDPNVTGDELRANDAEGLLIVNDGADPLDILLTRNTSYGNGGNGFSMLALNGSTISGIVSGNRTAATNADGTLVEGFVQNGNNGMLLIAEDGTFNFFDPTIGWQIGGANDIDTSDDLSPYAVLDSNPFDEGNSFSWNGNFGLNVISLNDSDIGIRLVGNEFRRNDLNGAAIRANSGTANIAVGGSDEDDGNLFANNGLNGLWMDLGGTVQAQFNIENNVFTQNGNNGSGGGGGGGSTSLFNIETIFLGGLTQTQQAIFALAEAKWESIIVGDVPDFNGVDDLQITAEGIAIDGENGILGQAGPTALRPGSFLPYLGLMEFDTADLAALEASGQLDDVILHEMGHVLGLGTIWDDLGLLTGAGTDDPLFTGTNAIREYNDIFNQNVVGVPVENTGGPGTRDGHWRESVFENELMTGFLNDGVNPISRVTVGQWQDLGYVVDYNAADPYTAPLTASQNSVALGDVTRPEASVSAPQIVQNLSNLVQVGNPVGDGLQINISGNATVAPSTILNNTITQSARHGAFIDVAGTANVPNLIVYDNTFNNNGTGIDGSGLFLQRRADATLHADVRRNTMNENLGDGFSLNAIGTPLPVVVVNMSDNFFNENRRHGINFESEGGAVLRVSSDRDNFNSNISSNQYLQSAGNSLFTAVFHNSTINDSSADGVTAYAKDTSIMTLRYDSPDDPEFTGIGTTINDNDGNGITANSSQRAQFFLSITDEDTEITGNGGDGVHLFRADASLFLAELHDITITGNNDDGVQFDTQGAHPSDINQPFSGTTNQLLMSNVHLDENGTAAAPNGGNGLEVNTYADSILVVRAVNSTFNGNFDDGVRAFSGDNSSFGESTGNRSTFSGVEMNENGGNGMKLMSAGNNQQKPDMFVGVNANFGDTRISDNGANGIQASVPYGFLDLLVQGDTVGLDNFTTKIQNNAGDGIQFNVADIALDNSDNEMLAYQFRNDGLLNLESTDDFTGIGNLTTSNITIGDDDMNDGVNDGNGGDGIDVYVGNSLLYGVSATEAGLNTTFFVNQSGQVNLNVDQTTVQNNGQRGITVNSQGIHSYAVTPNFFPISFQGNLVNAEITNSLIANHSLDGINFDIDGLHGRSLISSLFFGTITRISQNEILIDNNVIQNNGGSGVRFEANTGEMLRYDYQPIPGGLLAVYPSPFWGISFSDPSVSPGDSTVFNPFNIGDDGWTFYQAGVFSPILLDNYLNMLTDNNTNMRVYNNTIQFNGRAENSTASGLNIRISTNSYLGLDVGGEAGSGQGNFFSGNIGSDVKFRSFTATDAAGVPIQPDPATSTVGDDTAVPPVLDHILLDDTAQLDLRFNNNTGRTLDSLYNPLTGPERNAGYDLRDSLKGNFFWRATQVFQVDDGNNLNTNNNWTQDIESILSNDGNFWLRTVADPLFPNPDFPENWNTDPGDPFLP